MAVCTNTFYKYDPGKPLSVKVRESIIDYLSAGYGVREVARLSGVSKASVRNIRNHFLAYGTTETLANGVSLPSKVTDDILAVIEIWKIRQLSMYVSEIKERLLIKNICTPDIVPCVRTIQDALNTRPDMTNKKIAVQAQEKFSPANQQWTDEFLDYITQRDPATINFFDESGITLTTSNRKYGANYRGKRAIELQRYSSNANYTINLLHSMCGVDYFNVIPGTSNTEEMLSFFIEAVDHQQNDGTDILIEGDVVVMDNCGFHYSNLANIFLRNILEEKGVELRFQPPYSPEFCFNQIKQWLRVHTKYTQEETVLAAMDAMNSVRPGFHKANYDQFRVKTKRLA